MQWSSSLNYFSPGGGTTIAKVSVTVLQRFQYKDSHMIFCALFNDYVLDKCVCASARVMALAGVPHHVIRVKVRNPHQFPLKNKSDNVCGNVHQNCTAVRKCLNFLKGAYKEYYTNKIFSLSVL